MELKTLKDLEIKLGERYGMCSYCIARAKAEAIKWVKDMRMNSVSSLSEIEFMEFNNITEEDLK